MRNKNRAFYRGKTEVLVDFSAHEISSDGSAVLLDKIEREHKLIKYFSTFIPDKREQHLVEHSTEKMLKQRTLLLMLGYDDVNDVAQLKHDPLLQDVLGGTLVSQPTISRFENSFDKHSIFELCNAWVDKYVDSLQGRDCVTIDVDGTDDPTYGNQQLSMYNGYYGQFMYNELFFHDAQSGQIIIPVLRPGNSHSNKWYVSILKRIVKKIRNAYPEMEIIIRADGGFSCAPFYQLADDYQLKFAIGLPSNAVLKRKVQRANDAVEHLYQRIGQKHQHFMSYQYQAKSWHKKQNCYSKVESTGLGMNVRHIVSNLEQDAREIYFGFYVKRGETSENRIKEVKNMCFSARLSNHGFWANFFRLLISSLAYEMFLLLKKMIRKTSFKKAIKWQIDTIRASILKIGAVIKITKRRIYYHLSKAFVNQKLFLELINQ